MDLHITKWHQDYAISYEENCKANMNHKWATRLTFITIQSSNSPNLHMYSLKPSVSTSHGIPKTFKNQHVNERTNSIDRGKNKNTYNKFPLRHGKKGGNDKSSCRDKKSLETHTISLFCSSCALAIPQPPSLQIKRSHSTTMRRNPAHNTHTSFSHKNIIIFIIYHKKLTIFSFYNS